jgi:hypothetical protein
VMMICAEGVCVNRLDNVRVIAGEVALRGGVVSVCLLANYIAVLRLEDIGQLMRYLLLQCS